MEEKSFAQYENIQFAPLGEGSPVEIALLWGNPAKGPAALLVRFPEGYSEPWHSHSSTYRSVLIKGEMQSRSKDTALDSLTVFEPGSYLVQPGDQIHSEVNAGKGSMVAFVYFEGPVDFILSK